eukprot:1158091-Pelagomonas_calceolata.AAC.6
MEWKYPVVDEPRNSSYYPFKVRENPAQGVPKGHKRKILGMKNGPRFETNARKSVSSKRGQFTPLCKDLLFSGVSTGLLFSLPVSILRVTILLVNALASYPLASDPVACCNLLPYDPSTVLNLNDHEGNRIVSMQRSVHKPFQNSRTLAWGNGFANTCSCLQLCRWICTCELGDLGVSPTYHFFAAKLEAVHETMQVEGGIDGLGKVRELIQAEEA